MDFLTDKISQVIQAMRPLDDSYGQGMLDYIEATNPQGDLSLMPFFMFGHPVEVSRILNEKTDDSVYKFQKYPLIVLKMDFEEVVGLDIEYPSLNLAILSFTDSKYTAEQRIENIYKPVLAPLYDRLFQELENAGIFFWNEGDLRSPDHSRILRPFYGTEGPQGNSKYIFDDPLDAIEIKNLKLRLEEKNC